MSGDKMEIAEPAKDSSEEIRKKRISFLKATLNVYRSRALSLNSACRRRMSDFVVEDQMKNFDFLREQIRGLHNDISLLMSIQDSVNLMHNSLTCLGISDINDPKLKSEIQKLVSELSFFSQSLMGLYEESISEIEIIKRKKDYSLALTNYQNNLDLLKEKQKESLQTAEDTKRLQKAELQVNKINFIREMKLILIAKFAGNSEQYESLQQYRTPFRRNLTVDDFNETWDVGLNKC